MAQNKYLQLLRNSAFAADYKAAVTLIEANAPKLDGAPIIVRFNEGDKVHALLGVSYNETGAVHYVELGGERIADVKKALQEAIEAAKKAATTKVENAENDAHVKVTASAPAEDGSVTYTVESVDVASASATSETMTNLQKEIDALEELVGTGFTKDATVADAIEVLDGKIGAIKVVKTTSATQDTYTIEGAAEGSEAIVVDKDNSLISVELGSVAGDVFTPSATGEVIRFVYELTNGTQKTVDINMSHVITEAELGAIAANMAGNGLVASEGVLSVGQGTYTTVSADALDVNLDAVDAALVVEGTDVKAAIDAAQKAGEDAAAEVNDALTAHTAAYDAKVAELEGKISSAETAAKEYASGYTTGELAKLTLAEVKEEGKVIVSVKQENGLVSAELGEVAAKYVSVEDTAAKFTGETVEAVLAELDDKIKQVQGDALGIEEGTAIEFGVNEGNTVINVKVSETEGNQLQVTDNGLYVAADVDYKVVAGNGIEVTEKVGEAQTISVKVAAHVEGADANDMLTATADGLTMSNVWDCGTF